MSGPDQSGTTGEHGADREDPLRERGPGTEALEGVGAQQSHGPDDAGEPREPGHPAASRHAGDPGHAADTGDLRDPGDPGRAEDPGDPGDRARRGGTDGPGASGGPRPGDPPGGAGADGCPGHARVPHPRTSVEDAGDPLPARATLPGLPRPAPLVLDHRVLKSMLGAWALAACSAEEASVVEEHLRECVHCAEEAERLRDAVGLLQRPESLDLNPSLRTRVLAACLERRPPRIPLPEWATAYDAETARLDALLQDFGEDEWHAPVRLRWFADDEETGRRTTVAGVIAHLLTVDGLVAAALGLDDPLGDIAADTGTPTARTEAYWRALHMPPSPGVRARWREQSHDLVRTVAFTEGCAGGMPISYGGDCRLSLHDAMLDRAFECWLHAEDIAQAVDYPYELPSARHLNRMIDLAARLLPKALADRRGGPAASRGQHRHLVAAGAPGRSLRLEIEGSGGGEWLIPLDSPATVGSAEHEVAHIALDGVEFCRLAAGHVSPHEAAVGQLGDKQAIRDVLFAAASLSRM